MPHLSRRRFLEDSLLAAAAAAGLSAPRLFARDGEEPSSRSPNERLSVAVIGVNGRGKDHAKAFAKLNDCQVTYICDADQDVGGKFAAQLEGLGHPLPKYVRDMRTVFDDKSVDVVSIATPNHWHSLAAIWAMQAGKDVYVEKPVSHNISEGRRLVDASRKYKRICQAGTQYRSNEAHHAAAQYIRDGKLGKISLVRCVTCRSRKPIGPPGNYPVPPGVDYNLWAGPAPMGPVTRRHFHYDWHWFWNYGNGEIGNNSVHPTDVARLLTGLVGLGRGVMSYGGRQFHDAGQTANTQVAIHDFGDVTLVQEVRNLTMPKPLPMPQILVVGSEGHLVGSSGGGDTIFDPAGKQVTEFPAVQRDHFANFLKAVRSRKREDQNAEILEGHQSTALIHLANISYRLGQPAAPAEITRQLETLKVHEKVLDTFDAIRAHLAANEVDIAQQPLTLGPWLKIEPGQEHFAGRPDADALLTRQYRAPFVLPAAE
jgi:predicted dehydrogenase